MKYLLFIKSVKKGTDFACIFCETKMRQNEKGTGLGLMIARQIALRHGGDIQVDSVLQKGTAFTFAFDECTCAEDFA